jgi:hypothetical protein
MNCIKFPLEGIDLFFFQLLQIYPYVSGAYNAVDKAVEYKNSSKKYCYTFAFPGYGMAIYNTNQLIQIRQELECITLPIIIEEIGHLCNDLECNHSKILRYIFMAYNKIYKTVSKAYMNMQIARSYKNTGKNMCYLFINDILTCSPLEQNSKLYTCNDLNVFSNLLDYDKGYPDIFNLGSCSCNCPDESCDEPSLDYCCPDPFDSIIEPDELYRRLNMRSDCNRKTICDNRVIDPLCLDCCYY